MLSEKDIKLTINKLWNEMKNIKLEQNNAVYSVGMRTAQIMALMKIINRQEIFTKQEIQATGFIQQATFQLDKINVPIIQEQEKQLTLDDVSDDDLSLFVQEFNNRKKKSIINPKIRNKNAQVLKENE